MRARAVGRKELAMAMIRLEEVKKQIGTVRAVDGLTLEIPEGIVFGLLGPNGAGKTTLIRIISGLMPPTEGRVTLFGKYPPGHREALRGIGYMPQQAALYPGLSVEENILFYGRIYRIPERELRRRCDEVLEVVELAARRDSLVATLSGGMVRRAMLASTMVHRPPLLILDEPTAGVDPLLRLRFWDWFHSLRARGTTILVTTHHISEASRCQRVAFLRSGRVIEDGPPDELMRRYGAADLEAAFVEATRESGGAANREGAP
jgi:ABC-2 type transport system ATP-binding protein